MAFPAQRNFGCTTNQNVNKPPPIFIIPIDDQRYFWILCNVSQPFELLQRNLLGLFVDGREKLFAVESEADRNDQRLTLSVGRGEVGDASGAEEGFYFIC